MSASMSASPSLADQTARDSILNELDHNMLVEAAAGTGKTTSMVGRMVELIRRDRCRVHTMVAVTFTRKSAAELRSRFQEVLEKEAGKATGAEAGRLRAALANVDQCFIGTIHSFCGRLLRERPVEAGIDPGFREVDDAENDELKEVAWGEQCARMHAANDPFIGQLLAYGIGLSQLQDTFNAFAENPDVTDWKDEGIAITDADFDEFKNRLNAYIDRIEGEIKMPSRDDYGNCSLLPTYAKLLYARKRYNFDNLHDVLKVIQSVKGEKKATQKQWETKDVGIRETAEWKHLNDTTLEPACSLARQRLYPGMINAFKEASNIYSRLRTDRGLLNFQDLLLTSAALLRSSVPARRYFQKRFTHLLIDEFQDTDPIQAEVMLLLTAKDVNEMVWRRCQPNPGSLFVVGDPKQSIYRFRRADIRTYNEVKQIIVDAGGAVNQLSSNFRTSPEIIDWVNDVFSQESRFPKKASDESPAYVPLSKGRVDGIHGDFYGVNVLDIPKDQSNKENIVPFEAELIASTIKNAVDSGKTVTTRCDGSAGTGGEPRPVTYSDFLIIHYNSKQMTHHAKALQRLGIPCQVTGGTVLNEVRELKLLHLFLKATVEVNNSVALLTVMRGEMFGISDRVLYAFKKAGGSFTYRSHIPDNLSDEERGHIAGCFTALQTTMSELRRLPTVAAVERAAARLGLLVQAATRDGGDMEAGSFGKALEILRVQDASLWSVTQVIEYLDGVIEKSVKYDGISACSKVRDQVRLMNLHKVKGLEAPIVFLANAVGKFIHPVKLCVLRSQAGVEGFLSAYIKEGENKSTHYIEPPGWVSAEAVEAEFLNAERVRLQYVAATRAGSCLFISQRNHRSGDSWWDFYKDDLTKEGKKGKTEGRSIRDGIGNLVELFPPQSPAAASSGTGTPSPQPVKPSDVISIQERITQSLATAAEVGYGVVSAKAFSLSGKGKEAIGKGKISFADATSTEAETDEDKSGADWGNVIHSLLELKMKEAPSDEAMLTYAASVLQEFNLPVEKAEAAVTVVNAVTRSAIWQEATKSEVVLTEVPFQLLQQDLGLSAAPEGDIPTIVRGVIDLVFRNVGGGWTVVDYKTDQVSGSKLTKALGTYTPQLRLYAKAWESCCGEPAAEAGILFTRNGEFHRIDLSD